MSGQMNDGVNGQESDQFASLEAVTGLAKQVDELRRALEPVLATPTRVDDLAAAVADLADTVTQVAKNMAPPPRPAPTPAPSWLAAPPDPEAVARVLDALCAWLHTVYLRYTDAANGLPECWLWHPDVVEELLWLQTAWLSAYQGKGASVSLAGDWHDRQRPGVVRRIKGYAGSCSRENHQTRQGWTGARRGPAPVPGVDAYLSIAAWWATARDQPAPEPPHDPTRDPAPNARGVADYPPRGFPPPPSPGPIYPPPSNGHGGVNGHGGMNGDHGPDGGRWR